MVIELISLERSFLYKKEVYDNLVYYFLSDTFGDFFFCTRGRHNGFSVVTLKNLVKTVQILPLDLSGRNIFFC